MTVVGVTMCKDEADVIEATLRHMLTQVDYVIVADNGSTDGTLEIIEKLQTEFNTPPNHPAFDMRLGLLIDNDPAYYQSKKMTAIAQMQRQFADWVVPFDADEVWSCVDGHRIADVLMGLHDDTFVVHANLYDHICTGTDEGTHPFERMVWRTQKPLELPKAALRLTPDLVIRAGNHGGDYDETRPTHGAYLSKQMLRVDHFPYRSPEQFVRKVRNGYNAYKATDLDENTGTHWRNYGRILEEKGAQILVGDVFYRWFYEIDPEKPFTRPIVFDPVSRRIKGQGARSGEADTRLG